jgi:hypothetical protein
MIRSIMFAAIIALFATPAEARHHQRLSTQGQVVSHPEGCPRTAFCGCGVSKHIWGVAKREFYTARSYYSLPRATCAPGMVAILHAHHVAAIESCDGNGIATLYDPNSGGHQTRIHQRDISRATIVNPHGVQIASRHPHERHHRKLRGHTYTQYADASNDKFRPQ